MPTPAVSGSISSDSVVCRSSNHFKTDHDGETIIMSLEAGKFFTFDPIGFEIWNAFAEPKRVGDAVTELAAKHDEAVERVEADVIAFLNRLADEFLLDNA